MRKYKDQQQSFLSITASKSAAPHNLFVNKSLLRSLPVTQASSASTSKTHIDTLAVDVKLAHVKSAVFNCLNKTLFTKEAHEE